MPLKAKLKAFAASIGLNYFGVTSATSIDLLPGARSVICVAWPTATPPKPPTSPGGTGYVARYAWGDDYHVALREKLVELALFLQTLDPDTAYHICVDNNALTEKALASSAGLGWLGENSLLIVPQVGSWVMLGEILTTTILEPDSPCSHKGCGSCRRCIDACPTKVLSAPSPNWKRCLSYVTQMRGVIPLSLRPLLDQRIWGCDTCQAVCPANHAANETFFRPPVTTDVAWPNLLELLNMSTDTFATRFGNSAINWRGKNVLQRNAAIALGNWGDPIAVPVLINNLDSHASPLVRGACAWSLGQISTNQALASLRRASAQEKHPQVLEEIATALHVPSC